MARILISSGIDPISSSHNRLHAFADHLSERHQVTIVSIRDYWKASLEDGNARIQYGGRYDIRYCTRIRVGPYFQDALSPALAMSESLREILQEADIHLAYNSMIAGLCFSKLLLRNDIKTIYDIADDLPSMVLSSPQLPSLLRPVGRAIAEFLLLRNIELAEYVTMTAKSLGDRYHVPEGKRVFVPNGVSEDFLTHQGTDCLRESYGLSDCFVVGYVGTFREWVDFAPVLAAIKHLSQTIPKIRLVLVGGQGPHEQLKLLVKRFGIPHLVVFTGFVDYARVPDLISIMDAGVVPFRQDDVTRYAFPLKILEYMALGKPVISTPSQVVCETFGDRLLYAKSAGEFQGQISKLFESRELQFALGQEGRRYVRSHFTWKKVLKELDKALGRLC